MTDYQVVDFFRGDELIADPYGYFAWLRAQCPVQREPHHDVMMVTGYEEAIAVCDDVVGRFGAASEPPLREQVANAMLSKGASLGALGRNEEAIAVFDDVVERFGAASELPLREQVLKAMSNKALARMRLGRSE